MKITIANFFEALGKKPLALVEDLGRIALLARKSLARALTPPFEWRASMLEMGKIGYESMGVVGLLGMFTGMVLVVQTGFTLKRFGAEMYVSQMVALAMVRELGPVLAGFLVAGRVGSGISAEIGAMTISEQVDAMRSLGADPIRKLVVPKAVAAIIGLPLLTALADLIGIGGGMIMGRWMLNIPAHQFYNRFVNTLTLGDFSSGVVKTAFFGGIIAFVSCHFGFQTTGGTEGVGQSATRSVVMSCILILASDLLLTSAMIAIGGIISV